MVVMKGYVGYLWERWCDPSTISYLDYYSHSREPPKCVCMCAIIQQVGDKTHYPGEGRNRIGQLMSVQICDPKSYSSAPMVYHSLPRWCHQQRDHYKTMASCFADYRAKPLNVSKWSEFSEHDPISMTLCGSFRPSL